MKKAVTHFKILFSSLFFLFSLNTFAQIEFFYGNPKEIYEINQDTDPQILNSFLKNQKATEIEFNPNPNSSYPFRVKNNKGNWTLFHLYYGTSFMNKESSRYSFEFPTKYQEGMYFTWATKENKTYWVDLENQEVETKVGFEEVRISMKKDTIFLDSGREDIFEVIDKITVRNGDKWGLIEGSEYGKPAFYVSWDFLYNTPEEVPKPTGFQSHQLQMMEDIRKKHKVDKITALDENGYYLKGRNKESKLFGLFVGEGIVFNSIPQKYTKIIRHRNPDTFEVWEDEKVGYYNSEFELINEPIYDEFQFIHLDYKMGCAMKKDGYWQLFDSYNGALLVEGKAKTAEELVENWLNRHK